MPPHGFTSPQMPPPYSSRVHVTPEHIGEGVAHLLPRKPRHDDGAGGDRPGHEDCAGDVERHDGVGLGGGNGGDERVVRRREVEVGAVRALRCSDKGTSNHPIPSHLDLAHLA